MNDYVETLEVYFLKSITFLLKYLTITNPSSLTSNNFSPPL